MSDPSDADHLRILVVDDESLIAMAVNDQLEFLGYEVVGSASSALEAIDLARDLEPDLIVMDIHLGGMDGLEAAARINSRKRTPVVILTGFPDKVLIDRGKECGVVAHLVKPIDIEDLRQAVQRGWMVFRASQEAG
ncbi:MAG TPA: response regulator [Chloroflexota bacterium]|jgi:CheY-like chemotaxis protein|nr:response regulator [Chloroflexota bacterium]